MEEQPLVTVVVMTYQHAAYIAECLEGIVAQRTSFPIHTLVVDDASTDGTAEIVAEYARRYPKIIEAVLLKENMYRLATKTQQIVLPRLKGKYTALCEGDDYWTHPGKLQAQVDFLERHPDYSACLHMYEIKNETTLPHPFRPRMRKSRILHPRELILEHMYHDNTALLRSTLWQHPDFKKYYQDVYPFTDILIAAVAADMGKIWAWKDRWSVYRIHSGGVCTSIKLQTASCESSFIKERRLIDLYYGRKHPMSRWMRLYERLEQWTLLRRRGRYAAAIGQLFRAALYNPAGFVRLYVNRYLF